MEELILPLPSLKYLASRAVGRCLVLMKVDKAYWRTRRKTSLKKCKQSVDKLRIPLELKEYVWNVLRGFFEQVKDWIHCNDNNAGADILLDAHRNVDERKMARHDFENRHKDEFYRDDFQRFVHLLEYFSWHFPEDCSEDFMSIIVNLQKVNTSLEGPEYRLIGEELHVMFRFVNCLSVPPEFNSLLKWNEFPLKISLEQNNVLVTCHVHRDYYDVDMFKIHVDLLQPSQRLEFVNKVLDFKIISLLPLQVIRFLNVLDPETRRNSLLHMNERHCYTLFSFFLCWLIPGYESLFIPMLKLTVQYLDKWQYFSLFGVLVEKIDLIRFDDLLFQFWKLLPASKKSEFHGALERRNNRWHKKIKEAMKILSQANMALFQVIIDDVAVSLTKKQACRLLCVFFE